MARRLDDPESLALALIRRQFTGAVGPEQTRRRLARERRAARAGQARCGTASSSCAPTSTGCTARLELGDIREVDADLAAVDAARERAAPAAVALARAVLPRDAGARRRPLRRRRALADEALAGGQRAEEPVADQFHAIQIALLRRLRALAEPTTPSSPS